MSIITGFFSLAFKGKNPKYFLHISFGKSKMQLNVLIALHMNKIQPGSF